GAACRRGPAHPAHRAHRLRPAGGSPACARRRLRCPPREAGRRRRARSRPRRADARNRRVAARYGSESLAPSSAGAGGDLRARADYDLGWQRRMHDAGWAGIAWPRAYGGRGATLMEQLIWYEEYARAGAPDISTLFVGLNHAGPTLIACGSEAQKAYHLPRILRGDVIWCQGFSEPNAGSDL